MLRQLAILSLFVLSACGGADPKSTIDDGNESLGKGDYAGALETFEAALAGIDVHHPQYRRAALGRCEALTRLDPARAKSAFLELAKLLPDQMKEDDYGLMGDALLHVEANLDAVHVIHAGKERFPKSERMQAILEAVIQAAKRDKKPAALQELQDLGYV